jgi:hypothetical protein
MIGYAIELLIFIAWIFFSALVSMAAGKRGRPDAWAWFFLSLFISPLLSFLLLIALPRWKDRKPEVKSVRKKAQRREFNYLCALYSVTLMRRPEQHEACGSDQISS